MMRKYWPFIPPAIHLLVALAPIISDRVPVVPVPPREHPGAWVIVIGESSSRTVEESKIMGSGIPGDIKAAGLNWRYYDQDELPDKSWELEVETYGVPMLLILDAEKEQIHAGPLPSKDTFRDAVRRETGL